MTTSISNLDRYKTDLKRLIETGQALAFSMQLDHAPAEFRKQVTAQVGTDKADALINNLPSFRGKYESWYSESSALIKQVLPDRLEDFRRHYQIPKGRRDVDHGNYVIEDFMQRSVIKFGGTVKVDGGAAIFRFQSQVQILEACAARFESSLFDIRQLVHADILDSELAGASELLKNKFVRPAGVVAGIVLERHLQEVVASHDVKVKARPTLGDFIQALKDAEVLTTPDWRRLQHLNELRVKCTHNKGSEPTAEDVKDLIEGVDRTIKTLF